MTIKGFGINGKWIRILVSESMDAGSYQVRWDDMDFGGLIVPSGIYVRRMEAEGANWKTFVKNMTMGLMK